MAAWLSRHVKKLVALWDSGVTAEAIAKELGPKFTKNMVIGKVRRLGLKKRRSSVSKFRRKNPVAAARRQRFKALLPKKIPPRRIDHPAPPRPVNCVPVSILERKADQCAFSIGDRVFCGAPVYITVDKFGEEKRTPWCHYHWEVCHGKRV